MRYFFLFVFLFVYLVCDVRLGYSVGSPFYTHFTYMWQHAGLVHLVMNGCSFVSLWKCLCPRSVPGVRLLLYVYLSAVGASFFSEYQAVTVGASGMIFGLLGVYLVVVAEGKRLRVNDRAGFVWWLVVVAVVSVGGSLLLFVNGFNHLFSFVGGVVCGLAECFFFRTRGYGRD